MSAVFDSTEMVVTYPGLSNCQAAQPLAFKQHSGTVSDSSAASAFNTPWQWLRAVRCSQAPGRRAACIGLVVRAGCDARRP